MTITVVFDPPLPSDSPAAFNTKAFTLLGDLNTWSAEANAMPASFAGSVSAALAAPPAIGTTTPAAGSFTTLSASGQIQSKASLVATLGTPVCFGNSTDGSVTEVSSPSPNVLVTKSNYTEITRVSSTGLAVTGGLSAGNGSIRTGFSYDTGGVVTTFTNHNLRFATNNNVPVMELTTTNVLSLLEGKLQFPATQVPSANANTLDDYEEGAFSPTIFGSTTAGAGTYSTQEGVYTKVGRAVHFRIYLVWSAHTGTGSMSIGGLTFAANANTACAVSYVESISLTASNWMQAYIGAGTPNIVLNQTAVGGGGNTSVPMDTSGALMLSGTYFV